MVTIMFWNRFVTLCAQDRTSPSAVCARIGFSAATATHWKRGAQPNAASIKRVSDYFGVSVEYLTGGKINGTVKSKQGVRIPVFGRVAAGIPIDAVTDIEDYEEIPRQMAAAGEFFALRICGDSMEPKIENGDIVIVRRQPDCESDDIAIVLVNHDEATCKKIRKLPNGIMLISTNPKYDPMIFTNHDIEELPVTILGKVVELRAKF